MKEITEDQINNAINEVLLEISNTAYQDYFDATLKIPDEHKNNPLAYHQTCLTVAIIEPLMAKATRFLGTLFY